jgi:imidazolonepropionase-like amidohydrolase
LIRDHKVVDLHAPASSPGRRVDLRRRYLLPGFIDTHVHCWGNAAPTDDSHDEEFGVHGTGQRMLYAGVTSYLTLAGGSKLIQERDRQRLKRPLEANLYAAGPIWFGGEKSEINEGHCSVAKPEDADALVERFAFQKPDVIKLIYTKKTMSPPIMAAIVAAANQRGIKTVVHIDDYENARQAVEAGATAITHLCDDQEMPADLPGLMKSKGIYSIPTQAVQADYFHFAQNHRLLDAPLLKELVGPRLLRDYRHLQAQGFTYQWQRDGHDRLNRALQALHQAGVVILTGDDTGNLGTIQGYSLHREMELLCEGGLSPWESLAAATSLPCQFLGIDYPLDAGGPADLVVLNENPVQRIRATQTIAMVILGGRIVDRAALRKHFIY